MIYVDETGTVQKYEGVDSSNPIAPPYGGRQVVAEIHRGAGATYISGDEIFLVNSLFKGIGQNNVEAVELSLGTGPAQINASLIPIIDATNLLTAINVDTALTELEQEQAYPMDVITGNESENTSGKYQLEGYAPSSPVGYAPGTTFRVSYTSGSGTFNPVSLGLGPIYIVNVVLIGGGGGGGGGAYDEGSQGGGGGGGLSMLQYPVNNTTVSYSVGVGGNGGAGSTTNGGGGGANTTFGTAIAYGGGGGGGLAGSGGQGITAIGGFGGASAGYNNPGNPGSVPALILLCTIKET